jgi:formamidopyrimidine-DNA glycosylase
MPELPDLTVYLERIEALAVGRRLSRLRIGTPFVLRTVTPSPEAFAGQHLVGTRRIGKRLVLRFDNGMHAMMHLMVLGRLHWVSPGKALSKANGLAAFEFDNGTLQLVEYGRKRRAALHLLESESALAAFDRGGLEVLSVGVADFAAALKRSNHTLKRALTDPTILSGIGNAYSDEILHRACLSPFRQTQALSEAECHTLWRACHEVLQEWTCRLRAEADGGWPSKVTAFRDGMAVHGRYRQPCPVCGAPVQRIVYADNEANYCANCQTGGRILADRALSRLLKDNWPKTLDELEH